MRVLMLSGCVLIFGAVAASADCAAELARMGGGIAKDGSLAPLETPAEGEGVAKDGTKMPLQGDPSVATSPADVQAQQKGGETAAEGAMPDHDAALAAARKAQAEGDEAACLDALKGMSPS